MSPRGEEGYGQGTRTGRIQGSSAQARRAIHDSYSTGRSGAKLGSNDNRERHPVSISGGILRAVYGYRHEGRFGNCVRKRGRSGAVELCVAVVDSRNRVRAGGECRQRN